MDRMERARRVTGAAHASAAASSRSVSRAEAKSLCDLVGGERAVRLAGVAAQCGGDVGDPGQT